MKKLFLLLPFLCFFFSAFTQTTLGGKIIDAETGEELIGANFTLSQNGNFVTGTSTDFNGNYKLTLDPGFYDVEASYVGYPPEKRTGIYVEKGQNNKLNIAFEYTRPQLISCCFSWHYKIPLLKKDDTSSGLTIPDYDIQLMSTKNVNAIITTAPGVTFSW